MQQGQLLQHSSTQHKSKDDVAAFFLTKGKSEDEAHPDLMHVTNPVDRDSELSQRLSCPDDFDDSPNFIAARFNALTARWAWSARWTWPFAPSQLKSISIAALVVNATAFLILFISLRGAYHLSGEDALYGNSCGSPPPSIKLLRSYVQDAPTNTSDSGHINECETVSNQDDGETCASRSECRSGICVGGKCVLSDYTRGENSIIWGMLEYELGCCLFLIVISLVVAHQPSFGGSWKVAGLLIVFGGLVGLIGGSDDFQSEFTLPALTAGFALVIFYGGFHIFILIALATCTGVWAIQGGGGPNESDLDLNDSGLAPAAEVLPVFAAFFLVVFLTAHLSPDLCKKKC